MDTPKPGPRKGFERIGVEAEKAGVAMQELGKKIAQNKQQGPGPRKPHLTHRPFVNPAIVTLRKGLDRSVTIKKK